MYHLISCSICKTASPPPADVGWSMSDSGISAVGRHQLEYELQKILTVGWGINYISHHYPLCDIGLWISKVGQVASHCQLSIHIRASHCAATYAQMTSLSFFPVSHELQCAIADTKCHGHVADSVFLLWSPLSLDRIRWLVTCSHMCITL